MFIRVEQLDPFLGELFQKGVEPDGDDERLVWGQEEPENMGGGRFLRVRLGETVLGRFPFH